MNPVFVLTRYRDQGNTTSASLHSTLAKTIEHMAMLVQEDIRHGRAWSSHGIWGEEDRAELPSILDNPNRYAELLDVYPKGIEWFGITVHVLDEPKQTLHLLTAADVRFYVERTT